MHDPMTVAHEIYLGSKKKKDGRYRAPLITIWHIDPENDGTDDSCGWFLRSRHLPKGLIDKVAKEFESEWDGTWTSDTSYEYYNGWFNPHGENIMSVRGIVLNMYLYASKVCLNPDDKIEPGMAWKKAWRFIHKHYAQIMYFAENNRDSIRDTIVRKFSIGTNTPYTPEYRKDMIRECATIITADVMRKLRPWWQHPRWHFWHWKIQFHPWRKLKRRFWDKCCVCGKRGFKGSACGNWEGDKIWHTECNSLSPQAPSVDQNLRETV